MGGVVRLVHAAASPAAISACRGGKKSSAVTAPPVASRMREATSRPGHAGASEHKSVTYEGATPIVSAKSFRLMPLDSSQSRSLLIPREYSVSLKFSQDENISGALWTARGVAKTLAGMEKKVRPRFKTPKGLPLLRAWRKHRRLTQEQLAERVADILGSSFSPVSVSQLETGKQGYSQPTLEALAESLDCKPGDLLMRDPGMVDAGLLLASLRPETQRQALAMLKALAAAEHEEKAA